MKSSLDKGDDNDIAGYFKVTNNYYVMLLDSQTKLIKAAARFENAEEVNGTYNSKNLDKLFPDNSQGAKKYASEIDDLILRNEALKEVRNIVNLGLDQKQLVWEAIDLIAETKGDLNLVPDENKIKKIQEGLIADGYNLGEQGANGKLTPITQAALIKFTLSYSDEIKSSIRESGVSFVRE